MKPGNYFPHFKAYLGIVFQANRILTRKPFGNMKKVFVLLNIRLAGTGRQGFCHGYSHLTERGVDSYASAKLILIVVNL